MDAGGDLTVQPPQRLGGRFAPLVEKRGGGAVAAAGTELGQPTADLAAHRGRQLGLGEALDSAGDVLHQELELEQLVVGVEGGGGRSVGRRRT
jgi:hypothetical protein